MSDVVNLQAEQSVIGAALLDADCLRDIAQKLREEDFALETNREIWRALMQMNAAGERIDALTVADKLHADMTLRGYFAELLQLTPTAANAAEYAEIVAETGRLRRLREGLADVIRAIDEGEEIADFLPVADGALRAFDEAGRRELLAPVEQFETFFRYRERIDRGEKPYVRTGFRAFDRMLGGGLMDGGLYFLAARPGVGKTALAINIAEHAARLCGPVLFFSMEMSAPQITARRIAAEARLNSQLLLMEQMPEDAYQRVANAAELLCQNEVYLQAGKPLTIGKIVSLARSRRGVRLVIVDHFTLIRRAGKQQSFEEYAEIAHTLKRLAQTLNAPVLCLIQINREGDQKKGRPTLSDLRGTGATEEDADGVMILHREKTDGAGEKPDASAPIMERIYLDKNRFGFSGSISMSYWAQTNTFRETYVG